jgi:hypothetical protein
MLRVADFENKGPYFQYRNRLVAIGMTTQTKQRILNELQGEEGKKRRSCDDGYKGELKGSPGLWPIAAYNVYSAALRFATIPSIARKPWHKGRMDANLPAGNIRGE